MISFKFVKAQYLKNKRTLFKIYMEENNILGYLLKIFIFKEKNKKVICKL